MEIRNQSRNVLKGYNLLLYFAGSMIMYEPNEECIVDFWQQGIIKKLPVSSSNPNFLLAAAQLRNACGDKEQCLNELRSDFNRLFSGYESTLAPPYSSFYHQNQEGIKERTVSEFYESYGWASKFKNKVSDDHIGIELLFLTLLVEKYIALDDPVCLVEFRNEIRRFIKTHLLTWIREWAEKVQEVANSLSYKGIATLIVACIEDIYSLCDNNQRTPVNSQFFKN
jgi:putative dimethyl sulfoxide reductase chaperone